MSSISIRSICERARTQALLNAESNSQPLPPLPIAVQDPLEELLLREIGSRLPPEVAQRMMASTHHGEAETWLTVGAIFSLLLSVDPPLARTLLDELDDVASPAQAALAAAHAFGLKTIPPRPPRWYVLDYVGLVLQLVLGVLPVLFLRSLLLTMCGWWATAIPSMFTIPEFLEGLIGLRLLRGPLNNGLFVGALLSVAVAWFAIEAHLIPYFMEKLRQLPARINKYPPPLSWRADAAYTVWSVQALSMMCLMLIHCFWQLVSTAWCMTLSSGGWVLLVGITSLLVIILWLSLTTIPATLKLGTRMV